MEMTISTRRGRTGHSGVIAAKHVEQTGRAVGIGSARQVATGTMNRTITIFTITIAEPRILIRKRSPAIETSCVQRKSGERQSGSVFA